MGLRERLAQINNRTCDRVWGDRIRYVFMAGSETRRGQIDPDHGAFEIDAHHVRDTKTIVSEAADSIGDLDAFWRENSIVYRFDRFAFLQPGRRMPQRQDIIEKGAERFAVSDVFDNDFTRVFCAVTPLD